ncbi:hypothetical protein A6J66_018200 [Yersinia enterocolitica]|nr:hypothetical protein A6J66_018200 [Yersinia enterocolitica]
MPSKRLRMRAANAAATLTTQSYWRCSKTANERIPMSLHSQVRAANTPAASRPQGKFIRLLIGRKPRPTT